MTSSGIEADAATYFHLLRKAETYEESLVYFEKLKLIVDYVVTDASLHDSQVLEELIDDDDLILYADSAYTGEELLASLPAGLEICVHEKGSRNKSLTDEQKEMNREKSRVRSRIEHIFGHMTNSMGGISVRSIGKARAEFIIGLMNLIYNIQRVGMLYKKVNQFKKMG